MLSVFHRSGLPLTKTHVRGMVNLELDLSKVTPWRGKPWHANR